MNKEQQGLLDEVYKNYKKEIIRQRELQKEEVNRLRSQGKRLKVELIKLLSKEEFINKCKTDPEFSEKWGLTIEERELSENEINDLKLKLILNHLNKKNIITVSFEDFKNDEDKIPNIDWRREVWDIIGWIDYGRDGDRDKLKEVYADIKNTPTKLITITYNDKKIESYE
jgi:hypothetical protein